MRVASILLTFLVTLVTAMAARAADSGPVLIGLTAEFGLPNSTSAQGIERGIRIAIDEINRKGGVLGGRPLELVIRDDRSLPARGIDNLTEMAAMPDLVAVFGGRFSPVVIEMSPEAHKVGMILLDPWASADAITNHHFKPNYAFRLSLKDSLAMPVMLRHAAKRGIRRLGILYPNTAWGRSNQKAAERALENSPTLRAVASAYYNLGDTSLIGYYRDALAQGADGVLLVANDREAAILVREVANLPSEQRVPILSHWGVTGGLFHESVKNELAKIDFAVIQSFSFFRANPATLPQFMETAKRLYGIDRIEDFVAPVGVGQAYDLTHLLAMALDRAGTTDRPRVRKALEEVGSYRGLVKDFPRPFSPDNHDALGADSVFMARYRDDGVIVPLE
jgi:branched-chain amino acid transport system substrate-binding protein